MENAKFWLNCYNHNGELVTSTPFNTFAEAKEEAEKMVALCNQAGFNFKPMGINCWVTPRMRKLVIEMRGDYQLHLHNMKIAEMANY